MSLEAELAEDGEAGKRIGRNGADGGHEAERNGQIVVTAFLGKVGRRKVDRDPPGGKRKPRRYESGTHPLACLGHRLVRKAHHIKRGKAGRHLHLDVDRASLDALECYRCDPLDHA